MSLQRKIKQEREKTTSPFHPEIMAAWNQGFIAGAKRQNQLDTKLMLEWLGKLEEIPGIGEKTAWKIREHLLYIQKHYRLPSEPTDFVPVTVLHEIQMIVSNALDDGESGCYVLHEEREGEECYKK